MFNKGQGADDAADGTKEEDEGVAPRTRFADADPTAAGKKQPGSKKEVRVKEPPSEDGEEQKAKVTSIKKAGDKKGPPSDVKKKISKCKDEKSPILDLSKTEFDSAWSQTTPLAVKFMGKRGGTKQIFEKPSLKRRKID